MPGSVEVKDKWRDEGANRYLWFKADFNGDGIEDQANVLINKDNKKVGIFAFVSQKDDKYTTFKLNEMDIKYIEYVGLSMVSPGRYVTLCGKGGLYDCGDDPDEIVLSYNAIEFFFEGKNSRYFYWDSSKDGFKSVSITD